VTERRGIAGSIAVLAACASRPPGEGLGREQGAGADAMLLQEKQLTRGKRLGAKGAWPGRDRAVQLGCSARYSWASWIGMAPSPAAEATCLTDR
jgi:hypothetical protein